MIKWTPPNDREVDWVMLFLLFFSTYFFLAVLALHCYTGFSPVVASRGYSPVAERRLLTAVASLCSGAQAL